MENTWIIEDWTGKRKFPNKTFRTFEDGWAFIHEHVPVPEDFEDFYVVREGTGEEG